MAKKTATKVASQEVDPSEIDESNPDAETTVTLDRAIAFTRALPGDNYLTLAARHEVDPKALQALNGNAPVLPGSRIRIV